MPFRILLVDSALASRHWLQNVLQQEGYQVVSLPRSGDVSTSGMGEKPDLIIIDGQLSDIPADETCLSIRQNLTLAHVGILVCLEEKYADRKVAYLNSGADAFITKPFEREHVLANVRALLRRVRTAPDQHLIIQRPSITIWVAEQRILFQNRSIDHLTPKEFGLIQQLALASPNVVSKKRLAEKVWGSPVESLHQRTIDVHIRRLRQKLGPTSATMLKTVSTIGYQWVDPEGPGGETIVATNRRASVEGPKR